MPLEQVSNSLNFYAFYVASKQGVTGLTVTCDVYKVDTSGSSTQLITAGSATAVGGGLYTYRLTSANTSGEGEYIAVFKTSSTTPDQQHIPAIWVVNKAGVEYLDAATSTRLPTSSYSSPPSIAGLQADVTTILGRTDVATSTRLAASAYSSGTGAGSISYTVTVTRPDNTTPIEGCAVWVSTDSAGSNIIAGTSYTSASGNVTFMLDAGTYYLWRQVSGWNFTNPTSFTVS